MGRTIKPVALTSRAIKDINKIKSFNTELYGLDKAQEIIDTIFKRLAILETPDIDFTKIGAIDTDFSHLKHAYRKLIEHHYKIYIPGR